MTAPPRVAELYRLATPERTCPHGLKARDLLRRKGFRVNDNLLTSRAAQDAFKAEHDVATTPQIFIGGARVGGYDDLRRSFGVVVPDPNATSYRPVLAVFVVAALLAAAVSLGTRGRLEWLALERAIGFSTCILALLKLQDLDKFSTMFLGYDVLAKRYVRYATIYPFAELLVGVLMVARIADGLAIPLAAFTGGVGAFSVFKAVYVDKRDLKCACVGGSSKVPLGFVSLTENLLMVAMAAWMARGTFFR